MEKKTSELLQVIVFAVIVIGQIFLAARYLDRGDAVGMVIFSLVAILAAIAAFGHFIAWKEVK